MALSAGGFHRIAYTEWGERDNPRVLVCVHGLTRNGRDFDAIAAALSRRYRVICPDVVGRGASDRLADKTQYGYPQYCADMAALIARLGASEVDWLGTSMGGLIGMLLAARAGAPIRRLVLNDVGPFIPRAALQRLGTYVGKDPRFADEGEAEIYFRRVMAPFGALTDAQWRHVVAHGVEPDGGGRWRLRYDPAIGDPFRGGIFQDVNLWSVWDAIRCPTLVIRGAESDLLLARTAEEMMRRGPRAALREIPGTGHAPALMDETQIKTVAEWLIGE
ncbi:MAG: alpha/beta hydrolase [Alphaproteobacteria bacterium]